MAPVVNKTLAALAVAGIGVLGYAIYFDHKRRTDAQFRKRLRKLCFLFLGNASDDIVRPGEEKA